MSRYAWALCRCWVYFALASAFTHLFGMTDTHWIAVFALALATLRTTPKEPPNG